MVPEGLTFEGRPQLVARFRGSGGGRTLLLNGHVDVVDVEPRANWKLGDPFAAEVSEGRLYGRGTCDMKGGVASMVVAACTLAALGVPLAGDLIVNTVTEEESTGAGGLFAARLLQADAAIVPEPSSLAVWVACRGSLLPRIIVRGRAGHAGIAPLPPQQGGAVNAIEKMAVVLDGGRAPARALGAAARPPYLSAGDCVPTIITGGEWLVTYPAECALECHIEYLPYRADEHGYGTLVEREFETWIAEAAARDPWLREHPPEVVWGVGGVPPAEVAADDPIVPNARRGRPRPRPAPRARRPRQLARRRDAHGRGRHPRRLLRARRHPQGSHGGRIRPDPRPRGLRPAHRADGDAVLRINRGQAPKYALPDPGLCPAPALSRGDPGLCAASALSPGSPARATAGFRATSPPPPPRCRPRPRPRPPTRPCSAVQRRGALDDAVERAGRDDRADDAGEREPGGRLARAGRGSRSG